MIAGLAKSFVLGAIVCTAFCAGLTAAWITAVPHVPHSLSPASDATTARAPEREFSDTRTVALSFSAAPDVEVAAGMGGRVTAFECTVGSEVIAGEPVAFIDNVPVVALATTMPLWRDITPELRGDDVRALQGELSRLGFAVDVDGIAGPATMQAAHNLLDSRRASDTGSAAAVPVARFVWVPAATAKIAACKAARGASVDTADPLLALDGQLADVRVQDMPADLVPGQRVLSIDGLTIPVSADGSVTEQADVDKIASTSPYLGYRAAMGGGTGSESPDAAVTAEYRLARAIAVNVVPPSAVFGLDGSRGCVTYMGRVYGVTVVGSQMGQTYVVAASRLHDVDVAPAPDTRCT